MIKLKDVILIGGPTAAGKSLVSKQIAEKLQPYGGAIIINSDSMQIYKDLNSPKTKEFEKLLNSQSSKSKIEEGKIIDCKVAKITEKYIFR